jgi:quinoprotein dehydrogenase-associated probable ABC transporter substrate-binding protein
MRTSAATASAILLSGMCAGTVVAAKAADEASGVLRVCADPDNLPLSNDRGEGYENRIAARLAQDLRQRVEYTYFPQRMGFVRNTLRMRDPATSQYKCDVIVGVPKGYELTATTQPYMRSTYAMIFREREDLASLKTPDDLVKLPRAQRDKLKIGIFARSPAADWLLRNQMFDQAVSYAQQSGDIHENPASIIGRDLQAGKLDVAIVWGPVAGFLVERHSSGRDTWRSVPFRSYPGIKFDYEISMGVRFGEKEWKDTLDAWIAGHRSEINTILASYRIPLLDDKGNPIELAAKTSTETP